MPFRLMGFICGVLLSANLLLAVVTEDARELQFEVLGREVASLLVDSDLDESQSRLINSGFGPIIVLAIGTEEHWKRLLAGRVSISYRIDTAFTAQEPDFSKEMVMAVGTFHAGGITGQGHSREAVITRIVERQDRLSVYVTEGMERVGGGCMGQFFFHVVKLPRSDKTVELIPEK